MERPQSAPLRAPASQPSQWGRARQEVSLKGGLRRVVSLSGFGRVGAKPEFLNQMMCYIIKILNSSPFGSFSSETESIISPSYDISDIISQSLKEVVLIFNFFTLKAACV